MKFIHPCTNSHTLHHVQCVVIIRHSQLHVEMNLLMKKCIHV